MVGKRVLFIMYENNILEYIRNKIHLIKVKDILSFFLLIPAIPYAFYLRIKYGEIWIVREKEDQARDNGFAFFIKNCENDKDVQLVYVIKKESSDFSKLKQYAGHVIEFGSYRHWAYYLACKACISSVKRNAPSALANYVFRKTGIMTEKSYFLGHGITKDNAEWLHYKNTRFRMFFCGALPEYEYVKKTYEYPDGSVVFPGGLCRYDLLHDDSVTNNILVMPTWRIWLAPGDPRMRTIEGTDSFTDTSYFKHWKEFITSSELDDLLEENDLRVLFFPHPLLQDYIPLFNTSSKRIIIVDQNKEDLQVLINNSKMLITDFSSVYFDFIYQKKPILFFQFDYKQYRTNHYAEGWFNYDNNPFGGVADNLNDLIISLRKVVRDQFQVSAEYKENYKFLFPTCDSLNSKRAFEIIYSSLHDCKPSY